MKNVWLYFSVIYFIRITMKYVYTKYVYSDFFFFFCTWCECVVLNGPFDKLYKNVFKP